PLASRRDDGILAIGRWSSEQDAPLVLAQPNTSQSGHIALSRSAAMAGKLVIYRSNGLCISQPAGEQLDHLAGPALHMASIRRCACETVSVDTTFGVGCHRDAFLFRAGSVARRDIPHSWAISPSQRW